MFAKSCKISEASKISASSLLANGAVGKGRECIERDHGSSISSTSGAVNWLHQFQGSALPDTAIRKRLRNPDVIESALKQDVDKDRAGSSHLESVRPLMVARGRSYEARIAPSASSGAKAQPLLLLRKWPTGAKSRDDSE